MGVNGARIEDASTSKCDSGSLLGTRFTCVTGTKVQILTQKAVIDSAFCRVAPSLSAVQLNPAALLQGDVQTGEAHVCYACSH